MNKYLSAALLLVAVMMTAPAMADRDRGYHSKHHDYRSNHHRRDYDRGYHKGYDRHHSYSKKHYYAPHARHYRGRDRVIIHRDYRRDNTLEVLGGIYLLNEILHHPYHGR